jgi:AraC-like DNA-binding protein
MGFGNLRIKKICAVLKYRPESMHWKATDRTDHIVGIILGGSSVHDFGNRKIQLATNGVYFLNQSEDYRVDVAEVGECYSVHFTTYDPIELDSFCKVTATPERILRQIEQVDRLWHLSAQEDCKTMSALYSLLGMLEDLTAIPYAPHDARICAAKEYLDLHFREKDCIANAAGLCEISRRRFNDRFKVHASCTPNRYVTEKKIALAKELLALQELSVSQTASLCGFSDIYYFSKVFTEEVGIPPSKFRKQT